MVDQTSSEKTLLIVGVFFGVLVLCVISVVICCIYWRRQLEKERSRNVSCGLHSDQDRNISTTVTAVTGSEL